MVLLDLVFHYGGQWVKKPLIAYSRKFWHIKKGFDSKLLSYNDLVDEYVSNLGYIGVQQLVVNGPSGSYYEIEGDYGIRTLLDIVNEQFNVINIFAVEDCESSIYVPNITHHNENAEPDELEAATDCDESDSCDDNENAVSSNYDCDTLEKLFKQKKRDINDKLTNYTELDRSMTFKDIAEARKVIIMYALAHGYGLEQVKSDPTRHRYICEVGCPFVCHISRNTSGGGAEFRTLHSKHTCEPAYESHRVNSKTIAEYFKRGLQENPTIKVKEMRASLKAAFNVNVSESKCRRAKRLILENPKGSFTDEYNKLVAYVNELKCSNPGSDVVVNLSKDALAEGKRRFLRMYKCFHAMKMGFKSELRPFIGLDETFLKWKVKGQLLVGVGQDSANHFYPLAWAIVDKETKVTWMWFLTLLQMSLDLKMGEGITFISDMQKGLIDSISGVLPEAHHRFCVRHIEAYWCKRWGSGEYKKYLWWAAWSTYEEDFQDQLKSMSQVDDDGKVVVEDLLRQKPIIEMLEEIRIKVMNMLNDNEAEVMGWGGEYSPKTLNLYNQFMRIAQKCHVNGSADQGYEVTEGSDRHIVNLGAKKCTCRTWDLCGIPCPHAICALLYKKQDPLSEIHWFLSKEAYLQTYSHKLQPVRGEKSGR
ncbi:PREDICTED: uncharacterized protein LOC109205773 [Nicotiana attenuata]|uniref:uncharacterized protein LOC109205773 n=1 Tax=Nicotiana attenuata TaxID=49451 RepID=UPI0009050163|nr:PREDICTED: uncharacterized protein LOC109205773 [Nicotiana attenuata]